jgi:hypothetical protein
MNIMRKLENYTCTLEQSKKLIELGIIDDESLFVWYSTNRGESFKIGFRAQLSELINNKHNYNLFYSAFTSQELIEIMVKFDDYMLENYFDNVFYGKNSYEAQDRAQFLINYLQIMHNTERK